MKKLIITIISLIIILANSYSQKINFHQNDNWYFGNSAGITFNTSDGEPINLTGSNLDTYEGSASISDEFGNLLFYTDGVTVWDKNNNLMPNSFGLLGGYSSSNSALIIPNPKYKNLFYIFTSPPCAVLDNISNWNKPISGIHYSIVDMNLNNGNGEITVKNKNLYFPATEKLAAVHNLDNNNI